MGDQQQRPDIDTVEKPDQRVKEPEMFRVVLHNDDYTTMEFVLQVLEEVFHKSPAEAYRIMMGVHQTGRGVAGVYPHEVAETLVTSVHERARESGFPLRASLEDA